LDLVLQPPEGLDAVSQVTERDCLTAVL